jgi:predicted transcriptional regulator
MSGVSLSPGTGDLIPCHLLGTVFASVFYSGYVIAFCGSIHFLYNVRGRRVRPNKVIVAVTALLFLSLTAVRSVHYHMVSCSFSPSM